VAKRLFAGLIIGAISLCLARASDAATLVLASGQRVQGRIIEQTPLRITVDAYGATSTYYLGEIATIDGQDVEIWNPPNHAGGVITDTDKKPAPVLINKDEEDSLIRFMASRHPHPPKAVPPPKAPAAAPPESEKLDTLVASMHEMIGKMGDKDKTVIPTTDGGIIVVSADKIVKYDKNLNVVKDVKLKADNPPASK